MRSFKQSAVAIILLMLPTVITAGQAREQGPFNTSPEQVAQLLTRLDADSENLRRSMERAIKASFLNDAELGKYLEDFVWEFERMADRLKERSRDRKPVASEVQEILNRGSYLDLFVSSYDFGPEAESAWQVVFSDLNQLAACYKLPTNWGATRDLGGLGPMPRVDFDQLANRLIGTYKLDKSESRNARDEIERAVNNLPQEARRRTLTTLLPRLRAPEYIAIDRKADRITLASSLQPARVYTATGSAQSDQGAIERVLLYGGQFRLNIPDESDNIYSVTYATIERGARLRVTHTALVSQFARPLIVVSYYRKVSDTPRLNLDVEASAGSNDGSASRRNRR